jgi:hypothetical protein
MDQVLGIAAHYAAFATWLAMLIGLSNLMLNYSKNRSVQYPSRVAKRRYWPWILIVLLAILVAWGPLVVTQFGLVASTQILNPQSGTADTVGDTQDVAVKIDLDMPYEAFCTTEWGAQCYPKEKKDRLVIFGFKEPAPHDGGKVEWHATPIPLLKAYHDEVNTVASRDTTIGSLQTQIGELQSKVGALVNRANGLNSQIQAWAVYHDKVAAVITNLEKTDCVQQAIAANRAVEGAQKDKDSRDAYYEHLKTTRPGALKPGELVGQFEAREHLEQAQSFLLGIQKSINGQLDTLRTAP